MNKKADVVIMDPPRSGSDEAFLKSLIKIKPRSIVYISCNPDTQIRDVKILEKGGYKAEKCMPFDLFPYTAVSYTQLPAHETSANLVRSNVEE